MGLKFVPETAVVFDREYGGHPLLCRLAASFTYKKLKELSQELPVKVDGDFLSKHRASRDENLVFYCGHVVSELRDFYPDEYQVFELLACGQLGDYLDFAVLPEYSSHLASYGLVKSENGVPTVAIDVVGAHVALEAARREGRQTIQKLVPPKDRAKWMTARLTNIDAALGDLHKLSAAGECPVLFGPNRYPESHKFIALRPIQSQRGFQEFLNVCNLCFVESIEAYGKSAGVSNYFWKELKLSYPSLHKALHRIKVYRHNEFHSTLDVAVEEAYRYFMKQDLEGRAPAAVEDLWFTLQQATLDSFWNALQIELSRYGR